MDHFRCLRALAATSFLLMGSGTALLAQAATILIEPPIPLLPRQFVNWQRVGDAVTGSDPGQADPQRAAALKEDGLDRYATAKYAREAGGGAISANAMQFTDATGACSAFTLYRASLTHPRMMEGSTKLGAESIVDGDTVLLRAGTVVLRITGQNGGRELAALAAALPKVSGRRGLQPLLPTYLPDAGLEAGTVRYALGPTGYQTMGGVLPVDLLSLQKSAGEAIMADYAGRAGRGTLTLLLYPTPEIAGLQGRAIEKQLNEASSSHAGMGTVKMRRVGPLLGITMGGFSAEQAGSLLAALHLNSEIMFDKKMPLEFHAEVRKTASLLENIAVFSGVLAAAAVLLGLFLGGARAGYTGATG